MRDLFVFYCQKCGFYGYYQLPANAVCPKCSAKMIRLSMRYQDFMDLSCKDRDEFLIRQIIESSSVSARITASHHINNTRELIGHLSQQIKTLETENAKLNRTVDWMHQTIWNLIKKNNKSLKQNSRTRTWLL